MAVKVEDRDGDAELASKVLKPGSTDDQFMYMAYYRTKKRPHASPVKSFFRAASGMKALRQLFEQTGLKRVDDFITLSLMEVLEGNKYRDILNHDSTSATVISPDKILGDNVTSISEFKERNTSVGKKGKKKHVKLGWMSEKLVTSGETRILNGMKVLEEEGYVPKELQESAPTSTRTYREWDSAYETQREEWYNRHYGFGYGLGD